MSKLILEEGLAPDTPATDKVALYAKADGFFYKKADDGVEEKLSVAGVEVKNIVIKCIADDTVLTIGDGKTHITIPIELDGMNLISVGAHVYTASTIGLPSFQIHNLTDAVDMLSTIVTIDATEKDSKDATTPAVIDTTHDDVSTGDELRFDCDVEGTGTKGMEIRFGFKLP